MATRIFHFLRSMSIQIPPSLKMTVVLSQEKLLGTLLLLVQKLPGGERPDKDLPLLGERAGTSAGG